MTKLTASRFKQAEFARQHFEVIPEAGTPFEEVLTPDFWTHIAAKLKPADIIDVLAEDMTYEARLRVLAADRLWARVAVVYKTDFAEQTVGKGVEVPAETEVTWAGPHAKYRVVRVADKSTLRDGFATKPEAIRWAQDHAKAMAA